MRFTDELLTSKAIIAIANLELCTGILNILSLLEGNVVLSTFLVISRFSAIQAIIWLTEDSFMHLELKVVFSVLIFLRELVILIFTVLYTRLKRANVREMEKILSKCNDVLEFFDLSGQALVLFNTEDQEQKLIVTSANAALILGADKNNPAEEKAPAEEDQNLKCVLE